MGLDKEFGFELIFIAQKMDCTRKKRRIFAWRSLLLGFTLACGSPVIAQVMSLPPVSDKPGSPKSSADIVAPDLSKMQRQKPVVKKTPSNTDQQASNTEPAKPLIPKELDHLALQAPLKDTADDLLRLSTQQSSDEKTVQIIKGLSSIATTCLAIYGAELKWVSEQAQRKEEILSSREKRTLADQADMYVAGYMRVMFIGQQSSLQASTDSIDQIYVALKQESQKLVNRSTLGLLSMKLGSEPSSALYAERLAECRGFTQSKTSPYKSIFTDFLY